MTQSLREFDKIAMLKDVNMTADFVRSYDDSIGVQFSDYFLTNWPEQGSTPEEGIHFKPHQITTAFIGHQISPTDTVNENCLIRKIVWSYTTGFEATIKPRIAYLRLELINGKVAEINMKTVDRALGVDDELHELEGVFIITSFKMSSTILRLRLCGSYRAMDFEKAFHYYSLWEITDRAGQLLGAYEKLQKVSGVKDYDAEGYKLSSRNADFALNP